MQREFNHERDSEKISAFLDGEDAKFDLEMMHSTAGQQAWRTYNLINDLVKDPTMKVSTDGAFLAKLQARIEKEPKAFVRRDMWLKRSVGIFATSVLLGGVMYFAWPSKDVGSLNERIASSTAGASTQAIQRQQEDYNSYLQAHYTMVGNDPSVYGVQ